MLKIKLRRLFSKGSLVMIGLIIIVSYVGFYFRLQNVPSILIKPIWVIYTYIVPFSIIGFLVFALLRSVKIKTENFPVTNFIILLFTSFFIWVFLSLVPLGLGEWRHLIILTFYFALFFPTLYLFVKLKQKRSEIEFNEIDRLEEIFREYNFTMREKELSNLLMEGKTNKEISEELFVSLQTVKNYVSIIYKKVGLKNRVQFVNFLRKAN